MSGEPSVFRVRTVAILIVGGALLLLSALLLHGFGDEMSRAIGERPGPDVANGTGFRAFHRLADGVFGPETATTDTPGLLILTPTDKTTPQAVADIVDQRLALARDSDVETDDGEPALFPTLIVLPKWTVERIALQSGRVQTTGWTRAAVNALVPHLADVQRGSVSARATGAVQSGEGRALLPFRVPGDLQALTAPSLIPMIAAADGVVLGRVPPYDLYVLADPDLVNNRGMARVENARAAIAMLRAIDPQGGGRAAFDASLHQRPDGRNLVRLLFTPPFLGVTVALLVAAVLAGLAAAARFGPVRREGRAVALGKATLIDNIARLTRLAGRSAQGGERHADLLLDGLRRRTGARPDTDRAAMLSRLDRMGAPAYSTLDARLRAARNEGELVAAARAIHDWRKEQGA